MSSEVELSRPALVEVLLSNARSSLQEVHDITGVPVEELAVRYAKLFEDRGWRTERQEERLLLIELGDFIRDGKKRLETADDKDYSALMRVVLGQMTLMADRLDARKKLVEGDIDKIKQSDARIFSEALRVVVDNILSNFPELDPRHLDAVVREGLRIADERLSEHVDG